MTHAGGKESDNLARLLSTKRSALSAEMLALLGKAASLAEARGWRIYLVGGYVRDLILRRIHYDLDISVEGDALSLAADLQQATNAKLETTNRFGTAYLELGEGLHNLDLVTARREEYPQPGALPVVQPGTILDDLARRDFTINALAIELRPEGPGPPLDPHNGLTDIRAGLIRVLHPRSFIDDPTRIPRAVKYALRLGFNIEPETLELILQAVRDGAVATVSTDRMARELLLIMEEPRAGAILATLEKLGVLRAIHPDLTWPYRDDSRIGPGQVVDSPTPHQRHDTYLAILGAEFAGDPGEAERLARGLGLGADHVSLMRDAAVLTERWPKLGEPQLSPSRVYNLLHGLDVKTLQAFTRIRALTADQLAWSRLHSYLDHLQHVRPILDGNYLREVGLPPGPLYKRILSELLAAKLDGKLPTRAEEVKFVRKLLDEVEG